MVHLSFLGYGFVDFTSYDNRHIFGKKINNTYYSYRRRKVKNMTKTENIIKNIICPLTTLDFMKMDFMI